MNRRYGESREWTKIRSSYRQLKFIYSEKAAKFCEISTLLFTGTTKDKSKLEILQNFVAFLEYMNFTKIQLFKKILLSWWFLFKSHGISKFCLDTSIRQSNQTKVNCLNPYTKEQFNSLIQLKKLWCFCIMYKDIPNWNWQITF